MSQSPPDDWVVTFPTLGFVVADWVAAHCIVPDGFRKGEPFDMYLWQLWCTVNHYRVRPDASVGQLAPAFHNRRSQVVGPQKTGKGPWAASLICAEAVGPTVFDGFAGVDDGFVCADWGCRCGWERPYAPGEPMGRPWPTPLIQLLATSEDQTDNVYRPFQAMVKGGPLSDRLKVGEQFTRLPNDGRVDVVTSSATARLGNPITFALQDESGIYTTMNKMVKVAETMRRGLAGMGGRAVETTNAWDRSEDSTAKRTAESEQEDLFRFHRPPPAKWSYTNRRERRKIHEHVYQGCEHIDLDAIDAEAAELLEHDPPQAMRFFGNMIVAGGGKAVDPMAWDALARPGGLPEPGAAVALGFDGSESDDHTALIGTEFESRRQFVVGHWDPSDQTDGRIPRLQVDEKVAWAMDRWRVGRMLCDPAYWRSEIERWSRRWGDEIVLEFPQTDRRMAPATDRWLSSISNGELSHDGDGTFRAHVVAAHRKASAVKADGEGRRLPILTKGDDGRKIDCAAAAVMSLEAAATMPAPQSASKPFVMYS